MALPLPPGVDDAQFRAAMQKMADAIGSQWVYTEEDDVMLYRDAYSPAWDEPEELLPSAAVAPYACGALAGVSPCAAAAPPSGVPASSA